ncbi:restriction endonuclease [Desulfobulbus sp. AH-315-M07]|nr:restriction endonuclease [Desulfobulbus sp. AH-315-M07]
MILILILARFAPNVPRPAPLGKRADEHDTRPEITGDEFRDVIEDLTGSLGLETVFSSMGTGGVVEMTLRDPKPLTGGRILLHASPVLSEPIDVSDALAFAEGVRADMGALKGIMIALAGFSAEATRSIEGLPAPVDLIDGRQLIELLREHLAPDRVELVETYRGFGHQDQQDDEPVEDPEE